MKNFFRVGSEDGSDHDLIRRSNKSKSTCMGRPLLVLPIEFMDRDSQLFP
jgi:hypothetical protein